MKNGENHENSAPTEPAAPPDDERNDEQHDDDRPLWQVRDPGVRCDDPDSLCDTEGHELEE